MSEPTMDDLAAAESDGVDVENEAVIPNPELEANVPDWSNEPASDDLLAEQLQERGINMNEVEQPVGSVGEPPEEAPAEEAPAEEVPAEEAPADSPAVPAPDTSPPEEVGSGGEAETAAS